MPTSTKARVYVVAITICVALSNASAQVSFESVVGLAVRNSPRVKMVQDDVTRAAASLSESRDVYIPTLALGGGLGRSYGISFVVPTIATVTSQSLVYSGSQRSYIQAARDSLRASELALQDVREQVEEDAVLTYITLDEAQSRSKLLGDEMLAATHLFDITQQRAGVGIESDLDVKKAKRTLLQIKLQQSQAENEISSLQEHLAGLTGLLSAISTVHDSIPTTHPSSTTAASSPSAGVLSLQAIARAKEESAHGDFRYTFHPQIMMQAQYGRISPINDVSEYYNLNGRYNSTVVGVSIQLPLFDKAHAAHARETTTDARHAQHEAQFVQGQQREDRLRLENSLSELSAKDELASLDWEIAIDQLKAVSLETKSRSVDVTGGRQLTPKDELYSRLDEAQHHIDWLEADLQLQRTQVTLSRLNGTLDLWLTSAKAPSERRAPVTVSPAP